LDHVEEKDTHTPKLVEALKGERVCAVAAADVHRLAVAANGSVYSWGRGDFGGCLSCRI